MKLCMMYGVCTYVYKAKFVSMTFFIGCHLCKNMDFASVDSYIQMTSKGGQKDDIRVIYDFRLGALSFLCSKIVTFQRCILCIHAD